MMRTFALPSLALLLIAATPASESSLTPISASEAITLFKSVCADSYRDPARFQAAMADPNLGFAKQPESPSQARQPGDSWFSNRAMVGYADEDWMPVHLPSPQCSMVVRLADVPDQTALAAELATALALAPGKTSGGNGRYQTQWDLPADALGKQRIFFTTEAGLPAGHEARFSILNLRKKRK